jgi:hypothetical protein
MADKKRAKWLPCSLTDEGRTRLASENAHESNNIRACRLSSERIFHLQSDKIAAVAEHNFRFER